MTALAIGGITAFTTVDFPDHLAAVVFCQGCPWRCRYCHNGHLQPRRSANPTRWTWERFLAFLDDRRGLLEAVVFSGGEPTAQPALGEAMRVVRGRGFLIGLHTAGIYPERLRSVLPLTDWVGLDIKAPLDERYDQVTGRPRSAAAVEQALSIVQASGVAYQLRTTVHPDLLGPADCARIESEMRQRRAGPVVWQPFRARPGPSTASIR
jgi:pyruvate formate lyase activating enzyme